jgi:hypothetical protein
MNYAGLTRRLAAPATSTVPLLYAGRNFLTGVGPMRSSGLPKLDHEAGVEPAIVVLQTTSLPFADSWKIGALGETRTLMPVGRAF